MITLHYIKYVNYPFEGCTNFFYKFRTKVECGGQCMIEPTCSAFRFEDNSCQLYDANYLYRDKTDNPGMTVYMHDNLWSGRGNTIV